MELRPSVEVVGVAFHCVPFKGRWGRSITALRRRINFGGGTTVCDIGGEQGAENESRRVMERGTRGSEFSSDWDNSCLDSGGSGAFTGVCSFSMEMSFGGIFFTIIMYA